MIEQVAPLAAVLTVAVYLYRSDFSRYSIATTGVFKRFERSAVTGGDMDSVDMQCAECEKELVTAERRRYWKEIVIFGAPVLKRGAGESYYCEDHVSFELRNDLNDADHIYAERLPVGLLEALGRFLAHTPDIEPESGSDLTATDEITSGFSSAVGLLPIAFMVLAVAVVVELFGMSTVE